MYFGIPFCCEWICVFSLPFFSPHLSRFPNYAVAFPDKPGALMCLISSWVGFPSLFFIIVEQRNALNYIPARLFPLLERGGGDGSFIKSAHFNTIISSRLIAAKA